MIAGEANHRRPFPRQFESLTATNLAAATQESGYISKAARRMVSIYFAIANGVLDLQIRLGDNHMVAQEGCQNQMHNSEFV